jgi:hypothetical protein
MKVVPSALFSRQPLQSLLTIVVREHLFRHT